MKIPLPYVPSLIILATFLCGVVESHDTTSNNVDTAAASDADAAVPSSIKNNLRRRRRTMTSSTMLFSYGQILSGDTYHDNEQQKKACIELPPESFNQVDKGLILGDCTTTSSSSSSSPNAGWRFDKNGRIHSQWNDDYCITLGRQGVRDGTRLKLQPCDDDNILQKFIYHNSGRAIRPKSFQDFCITWRGNHADVGVDPIIIKKCEQLNNHQRHWIGNFPRYNDDEQQQESSVLVEGSG